MSTNILIWLGILLCLSQSAMFSGLNLAMFGVSRLRLEVEASTGDQAAKKILVLRQDSNFLLTTILWGNVAINVLLTLLSNSVMAGLSAFLFSTFAIAGTVTDLISASVFFCHGVDSFLMDKNEVLNPLRALLLMEG